MSSTEQTVQLIHLDGFSVLSMLLSCSSTRFRIVYRHALLKDSEGALS